MQIKFLDFQREYQSIKNKINQSIFRVLKSGWYILGSEVESFEKKLASYIGVKYAVGLASGTDALTIAVKALGLTEKDGVMLPANVYPSVFGVERSGVEVQLADVDPDSLNISLESIKKNIKKNTKAIVVVHLYGNPVDILAIRKFCKEKKLYLIEDCAQAIGAEVKGKKVGTFGDIACFSFYPTKNLGAYGDAGAVLTNNKKIFEKARLWRMYGEDKRYHSVLKGMNSRLDEIQAAILSTKLNYLKKWTAKRIQIANLYQKKLVGLPISFAEVKKNSKCVYHLFVIRTKKRDQLAEFLKLKGIATGIHYPIPIHLTPSFKGLGYKKGDFPESEKACDEVLSIPIYPTLSSKELNYVVESFFKYFKK